MNGCLDSANPLVNQLRHHITTSLYFFCLLSSNFVGAQNQIVFRIVDSATSTAISDATILVTFAEDGKDRTVFDITDTNGYGRVEISQIANHDSIFVSINHLNYNKFDTVYIWEEIKGQEIVTLLSPRSYDIEPIIIQSVKVNPYDTVHIAIDTSELKKTNKLTELLKKDHRFKLEDNYLTFNNKSISRILIDDTDITGNNYISFLHQLSATDFESMDVIQFYYDNPLDQYFNRPEVALRLNTKKDGKIKKTVSIDGSFSQIRLNELRAESYVFTHNYKAYLNATRHITSASTYKPNPFSRNEYSRESYLDDYKKAFSAFLPAPGGLPFEYYNNKKSSELLYQSGFPMGKFGKNRLVYGLVDVEDRQSNSSGSILYLPDSTYAYQMKGNFLLQNTNHRIENEFKYFKKNTFVNWLTKGSFPVENFYRVEEYSGDINESKKDSTWLDRSSHLNSQFTLARALNKNNQLQFTSDLGHINFHETYLSANKRNAIYFTTLKPVLDNIHTRLFTAENTLILKSKSPNHTYTFRLGNDYYLSRINLIRRIKRPDKIFSEKQKSGFEQNGWFLIGSMGNGVINTRLQYDLKGRLQYSRSRISFNDTIPFQGHEWLYNFSSSTTYDISNKYTFNATLSWKKDWIRGDELSPIGFNDGSYLLFSGLKEKPLEQYLDAYLSLSKNYVFDLFNFNLDVNYRYFLKKMSFAIQRDLLFGRKLLYFDPAALFDIKGSFKYKIFDFPMEISLDNQYYHISSSYYINEIQNTDQFIQINNVLKLDSRWKSYGIIGSFGYGLNIRNSIEDKRFLNNTWKGNLDLLYINQDEKIDGKIGYEISQYSEDQALFHGVKMSVDYYISKTFNVGIYGINLLNQKHFEYRSDETYSQYFTKYDLVPLQLGIRFHWDIL